jgi:hypothetical protein
MNKQHDYRTDHGDQQAPQIEAGNALGSRQTHQVAANNGSNNAQGNVREEALAGLVDDLTADEACQKAKDDLADRRFKEDRWRRVSVPR